MSDDERRFAYGMNHHDGATCPAATAGMDVEKMPLLSIAEEYDELVEKRVDDDSPGSFGTIPEDLAEELWMEAIDKAAEGFVGRQRRECRRKGEQVASELGWSDDD